MIQIMNPFMMDFELMLSCWKNITDEQMIQMFISSHTVSY